MLESSPPLRKLDTGTSATRWAATDSSITLRRSAGGPAAASAATSSTRQYRSTCERPVRAELGPRSGRKLLHAFDGAACSGTQ